MLSHSISRKADHELADTSPFFSVVWDDIIDITYASLAKAFGQELSYHEETQRRMEGMMMMMMMMSYRSDIKRQMEVQAQKEARLRMTLFPKDAEVFFVAEDLWVVRTIS